MGDQYAVYTPAHFLEDRESEILQIMAEHPLAVLVASTQSGLLANHVPILAEAPGLLIGHIALNNDLHREIVDGSEILAIFRAEDAYVSPNWYPSKAEHHRHVPTWNYRAVHVQGTIRFSHDRKDKAAVVGKLTRHFERLASGARPWRMADAPREYMDGMLDMIVAFEIAATRTIAKSKLGQNRETRDAEGAAAELEARGHAAIAEDMRTARRSS